MSFQIRNSNPKHNVNVSKNCHPLSTCRVTCTMSRISYKIRFSVFFALFFFFLFLFRALVNSILTFGRLLYRKFVLFFFLFYFQKHWFIVEHHKNLDSFRNKKKNKFNFHRCINAVLEIFERRFHLPKQFSRLCCFPMREFVYFF